MISLTGRVVRKKTAGTREPPRDVSSCMYVCTYTQYWRVFQEALYVLFGQLDQNGASVVQFFKNLLKNIGPAFLFG